MVTKLSKLLEIFYKSAQQRRRVVPRWQVQQQAPRREPAYEGRTPGMMDMDDFTLDPSMGVIPQYEQEYENEWTQGPAPALQEPEPEPEFMPQIVNEPGTAPQKQDRPKREKKEKRPSDKKPEELARDYWKQFEDPENVDPDHWKNRSQSESERDREAWRASRENLPKYKVQKERVIPEDEAFDQAKQRMQDIKDEIQSIQDNIKPLLLSKVMSEQSARNALVKANQGGGKAELIKIPFPKTPYKDPFIGWAVVQLGSGSQVVDNLLNLYRLKSSYNDILLSMKAKKEREESQFEPDRFKQFFHKQRGH